MWKDHPRTASGRCKSHALLTWIDRFQIHTSNTSLLLCVAIALSTTWMASRSYAAGQRERADFYGLFYGKLPSVLYPEYLKKCPSPKYANEKFMRPWFFALPLGNAHIGAMVFGETDVEEIQINEKTLWSGGPGEYSDYNYGVVNGNHTNLKPIQEVLLKERDGESVCPATTR